MRSAGFVLIAGLLLLAWSGTASAARCADPRLMAPGHFNNPGKWKNDDGVVVDGFLDLSSPGGRMEVSHGVDLSQYQAHTDYDELKRCGTEFAIVKYKPDSPAVFLNHVAQMKRVGITAWPYFYLGMDASARFQRELFDGGEPSASDLARMEAAGRAEARGLAPLFRNAEQSGASSSLGGVAGRVVFVDVEDKLDPTSPAAVKWRANHGIGQYVGLPVAKNERDREKTDRERYSKLYAAKVAAWIREFQTQFPDVIIVLYTSPSVYTDYLVNGRFDDIVAYHGLPIWLANYLPNGGEVDWGACHWDTSVGCKGAHRLCHSVDGGNRCILHQYTSRGIFGVLSPPGPGAAEHIDLSRLFPVAVKRDGAGPQYVRREPNPIVSD